MDLRHEFSTVVAGTPDQVISSIGTIQYHFLCGHLGIQPQKSVAEQERDLIVNADRSGPQEDVGDLEGPR
jgi:hypothetical protein